MTESNTKPAPQRDDATRLSGMTRGIAHAITVVIAAFVGGFTLLFILARVQNEDATVSHPLDFLIDVYRATGVVEAFVATALIWIAIFAILTELLAAAHRERTRGFRTAIAIEVVAFAAFIALWYLPL